MTPWQKENLKYLKTQGDKPGWETEKKKEHLGEPEEATVADQSLEQNVELGPETEKKSYESFADRLPNVKKVRNKRLVRRLTIIISIFALAILMMLYFVSPFSKLGSVTVTGNEAVDSQTIIQQSKLKIGDSLWNQFNSRATNEKQLVKQLPHIKKASIVLSGINSFKVVIEEYQVVALESVDGLFRPVLENGKILPETITTNDSGLPVFQNFEDETIIKNLIDAYNQLSTELKEAISEIVYTPSNANKELVTIHMKNTNIVIVNISQMAEKMAYYTKVASQMDQPGTIDMEVGIFSYPFTTDSSEDDTEQSSQETE